MHVADEAVSHPEEVSSLIFQAEEPSLFLCILPFVRDKTREAATGCKLQHKSKMIVCQQRLLCLDDVDMSLSKICLNLQYKMWDQKRVS